MERVDLPSSPTAAPSGTAPATKPAALASATGVLTPTIARRYDPYWTTMPYARVPVPTMAAGAETAIALFKLLQPSLQ
jgi:hypothetical protein